MSNTTISQPVAYRGVSMTPEQRKVVFAASLGTAFEWYDFLLFASLSPIIAAKFFAALPSDLAFIFALLAYSAAYALRPLGAIVLGRLGDIVGRKFTFLISVSLMGAATFLVGILPDYNTWGLAAPIALLTLRMVQGLSLGGEFGGAATYVAEHAPEGRRAYFTSWINCTAAIGFVLSLIAVIGVRSIMGEAAFGDWGWRLPFIFSLALLVVSVWIRLSLSESPVFLELKRQGKTSKSPLIESFGNLRNIRLALAGMFGVIAGSAVLSTMGLIYPLLFLSQTLKVAPLTTNVLAGLAILVSLPLFPFSGWLADRFGRKPVIIVSCLIGAVSYFPVVKALTHFANPAYEQALASAPVTVVADPAQCSFMFNPTGTAKYLSSCDIAHGALARAGVNYTNVDAPAGTEAYVKVNEVRVDGFSGFELAPAQLKARTDEFNKRLIGAVRGAGYPEKADPAQTNLAMTWLLMLYMAALAAMSYAPVSAVMVELFPARIRYTAMSVPYHLANGWVAGFLIPAVFALVAASGNIYFGLWYPVAWAILGAVVTLFFVPETKNTDFRNWH
ncbi:MFS transporter [Variovorax sp. dw_954]|uniref:MFS transporter n=1 Tax=Variovorax sp. dw_954 TaxID=2720078 RepID=UPI001BD25E12|nr:MFS transporter [Variovorax sp. dw_954]